MQEESERFSPKLLQLEQAYRSSGIVSYGFSQVRRFPQRRSERIPNELGTFPSHSLPARHIRPFAPCGESDP